MRTSYRVLPGLLLGLLMSACGDNGGALTTTDGSSGDTGTTTDEPPTTDPTTGATAGPSCIPGASTACACTNGNTGAQVCQPDGKSLGACVCEGGGSGNSEATSTSEPGTATEVTGVASETTDEPDTTTDDGTTTDVGTTSDGTTGEETGGACEDPGPEPNEDEGEAVALGDQACMVMPGTIEGVLLGDADVDWFTYHTVDGMGCGFDDPPTSLVLFADGGARMCAFFECDMGGEEFDCPMMASDEDSPDGVPGCCTDGTTLVVPLNCMGSPNESSNVWVRLDEAAADACVSYNVTYTWGPM